MGFMNNFDIITWQQASGRNFISPFCYLDAQLPHLRSRENVKSYCSYSERFGYPGTAVGHLCCPSTSTLTMEPWESTKERSWLVSVISDSVYDNCTLITAYNPAILLVLCTFRLLLFVRNLMQNSWTRTQILSEPMRFSRVPLDIWSWNMQRSNLNPTY